MARTTAQEYLQETVMYGGIPTRRIDVERHLDALGVTGPARLAYGRLPAVDTDPVPWDEHPANLQNGER